MAHIRNRFVYNNIVKTLKYSPLVGVLGHRQVGKTTLVESLSKQYYSLDDENTLHNVNESPKVFLEGLTQLETAIDECQLAPQLFPALKERVRKDKRPGQFILTGSVRFSSRKAIRESLTGRILNHEVLPFTISELNHLPMPNFCLKLIQKNITHEDELSRILSLPKKLNFKNEIENYKISGGLPSLCFVRDKQIQERKLLDQLNTIIDRDIRLIYPTTLPFSQLFEYLKELALLEGQPVQYSHLEKKVKISDVTQKKILYALEAVFLIRIIPLKGGKKNFTLRLEDQAESFYLRSLELKKDKNNIVELEGLLYRHLRCQFMYQLGFNFNLFQYQTRGGARVPIVIDTAERTLGFIVIEEEIPNRSELATATSFYKAYSNSSIIFVPFTDKSQPSIVDHRSMIIPLKYFL